MSAKNNKAILGVDIDNVIADTDRAIRKTIRDVFGVSLRQEEVVCYEYHRCGITKEQEQKILEIFRDTTCSELFVVPGAVEALKRLQQQYEVVLVTSRNPVIVEKTRDWLRWNEIPHDHLIFEKEKHQTGRTFEYFIEDNAESALSLAEAGVRTFVFDYPWNRAMIEHPNITRVRGWHEVLAELI
jgi:uncharacterized HAD superfamily protein